MKTLGRIVSFDENTCVGEVQVDLEVFRFHSTSFRSATSFRWPRVGEQVELVLNQHGHLVSVEAA
jgi:hypothetical protein